MTSPLPGISHEQIKSALLGELSPGTFKKLIAAIGKDACCLAMERLLLSSSPGNDAIEQLAHKVPLYSFLLAKAFDAGILNCQRVLEMTVLPFMELAQKCQLVINGFPQLRSLTADRLFAGWADGVTKPLCWHSKCDQECMRPSMQSSKRDELVKAMMAAKIHEAVAGLLPDAGPRLAYAWLDFFQGLVCLPFDTNRPSSDLVPLTDRRSCAALLKSRAVADPFFLFCVTNFAENPSTDLERVAFAYGCRAAPLLKGARKDIRWKTDITWINASRSKLECLFEGEKADYCDLKVSPDLMAKANMLVEFLAGGPVWDARWATCQDALKRLNCPGEFRVEHTPIYTGGRAVRQHCSRCGISGSEKKLLACTRCRQVWYCGKECQVAHWKSGHKKDCKAVDK